MNYKYYVSNYNGQDDYGLKCVDDQGYGLICKDYKLEFPPQHQNTQPGMEYLMQPRPIFNNPYYRGSGKLTVVIAYYNEHKDAEETKEFIERLGGSCLLLSGDIKDTNFCDKIVEETMKIYGKIDILVNGRAVQYQQ